MVNPLADEVHSTPNQPSGVLYPPSAEGNPDVWGAIAQVWPSGEVTVKPRT